MWDIVLILILKEKGWPAREHAEGQNVRNRLNPYSEGERRAKVMGHVILLLVIVLILILKEKGGPCSSCSAVIEVHCLNPYSEGERRALLIINQLNIIGQYRQ